MSSRRALGNLTLAGEDVRDVWILRRLDELVRDVRHGPRMLRRNPGFPLVALLSLSLGIGANTAIFSLIDAVVLKALPRVRARDPRNQHGDERLWRRHVTDLLRRDSRPHPDAGRRA